MAYALGLVIGLLIVLSSAAFPAAVARYEHLHTAANYRISALSLSDCAFGVATVINSSIRLAWPVQALSSGLCAAYMFSTALCNTISNGIVFWLALDRYTAVHHPFMYPLLVTAATVRWELVITVLSALMLISFIIIMQLLTGPPLPEVIGKCAAAFQLVMGDWTPLLQAVNLVIIVATLTLSLNILLVARRVLRADVVAMPHELSERARLRQHMRTFYYLLRVFVLYGVCVIPFSAYSLTRYYLDMPDSEDPDPLWVAVLVLRGMFNLIDSWLYCGDPELRQAVLHFWCGSRCDLYP